MTAAFSQVVREAFHRHPLLASYAMALFVLGLVSLWLQGVDPRALPNGENVWIKPTKFLVSVGLFALTAAWFVGYVRHDQRRSTTVTWSAYLLVGAGTFEIIYICAQALAGEPSHFNVATPFAALMYALMGVAAVLLVGTTLPLAWKVAREPVPGLSRSIQFAVVAGLVLTFVLGGGTGALISVHGSSTTGEVAGLLPIIGWNRSGGDLRISHFLGMHAAQVLPAIAIVTSGRSAAIRWSMLIGTSALYTALTLAASAHAHGATGT